MANIPFLNNTSFSAAITVANSATASNFITTTDSGININGITLTRVAANSAIRVSQGLETLGLLRSYSNLIVATTGTFGGDVSVEDNLYLTDSGTVRGKIQLNSSDRDDLDIKAVSLGSNMKFFTVDTERMRIDSSGNVGIGTTSPTTKLQISANNASSPTANIFLDIDGSNQPGMGGQIIFGTSTSGSITQYIATIQGVRSSLDDGSSDIHFQTTHVTTVTGPTTKMTILSGGNVGIGTTSPQRNLTIYQSSGNAVLQLANNTSGVGASDGFLAYTDGVNVGLENKENGYLSLATNASEKMRITSAGNVGIGTTSPSSILELSGTTPILTLSSTAVNVAQGIEWRNSGTLDAYIKQGPSTAEFEFNVGRNTTWGGDFKFVTDTYDAYRITKNQHKFFILGSAKMTIDGVGNVGIGTTSPNRSLHVIGQVAIDNSTSPSGGLLVIPDGTSNKVYSRTGNANNLPHPLDFISGSSTSMRIAANGNVGIGTTSPTTKLNVSGNIAVSSGSYLSFIDSNLSYNKIGRNTSVGGIQITTGASATMNLLDNGNVGIGTTSPLSALDVEGNIELSGVIKGRGSDWTYYSIPNGDGSYPHLFYTRTNSGASLLRAKIGGGLLVGSTEFTNNNFSINSTQLYVRESDGNVGIGTTSPNANLDILNGTTGASLKLSATTTAYWQLQRNPTTGNLNISDDALGNVMSFDQSTGNVGIGTDDPGTKLQLKGDSTYISVIASDGSNGAKLGTDSSGDGLLQLYSDAGVNNIKLYGEAASPSYINAGNVGIGTTAPSQKLHISGNMRLTGAFRDRLNSQGAANYVLTSTGSNGTQWVDASGSSIIGGPYLPLDGGTMTGTNGVVFPDAFKLNLGTGSDLQIYHDGSNSYIQDSGSGGLRIASDLFRVYKADLSGLMINAVPDDRVELYFNDNKKLETTSTGVSVTGGWVTSGVSVAQASVEHIDNAKATFGNGNDLQIYHDGSNSYIKDVGTGFLNISSDAALVLSNGTGEPYFIGTSNGSVKLYYDNNKKLETGIVSVGTATIAGGTLIDGWKTTTQANAINDTTIATTAYVNNKIALIPAGLVFQGTWNAATNSPTLTSGSGTTGNFYIVSVAGSTNLDGITDWKVGDWAVFIEQGASDQWEKIDNSSVLDGIGTGGSVAGWAGSGTSNTLTNSPITFSGNNVSFAGNGTFAGSVIAPNVFTQNIYITSSGTNSTNRIDNDGTQLYLTYGGTSSRALEILNSNGNATFAGDVTIGSSGASSDKTLNILTGGSKSAVKLMEAGTVYGFSTVYDGATNKFHINRHNNSAAGTPVLSLNRDDDNATLTGNLYFSGSHLISSNTADGSDNAQIIISGGGADGDTRGATVHLAGNENGNGGLLQLRAGVGATSQIRSYTSGSEKMRILAGGNVGIGTTAPANKLNVNGDIGYTGVIGQGSIYGNTGNSSFSTMQLYDPATGYTTLNNQSYGYYFNTSGGTKVTILNSGNVGIGETSPQTILHVGDGGDANVPITIAPATGGNAEFRNTSSTGSFTFTNANGSSEKIRIASNGNVGIGTTAPTTKLYVHNGEATIASATDGVKLSYSNGNSSGIIDTAFSDNNLELRTNGTAKMWIANGGNVGIGTTSPDSKLDVTGGDITVNTSGTGFMNFKYGAVGSETARGSITTDGIDLKVNATADLLLLPTGNVGIGTTSPSLKLEVAGNIGLKSDSAYLRFRNAAAADLGYITNSTTWGDSGNDFSIGASSSNLRFYTNNSSTERMRIDSAGAIKFNAYGAGTLVSDASGNITAVTSGAGTGTVTSITKGAGLVVAGSPITTTGSVAVEYAANVQNIITGGSNFIGDTVVSTDQILITDPGSTSTNRRVGRVEIGDLPFLSLAGGTMTGAIIIPEYITHAGDTDTKFGFTAANQFQVIAGGNTNLNVQGNGVDLSYAGSTRLTTQTGGIAITGDLTVTADVGIGTTSPQVPLDVTTSDTGSSFNDGAVQISNTTSASSGGATVMNIRNNYGGGFGTLIKFFRTSVLSSIANISFNSGGTAVNYNTGSDYRLKEDLQTFNGLDILNNISVYNYKWKGVDFRGYGVIAHELQPIFPDAVTGEKDAEEMQSVDYSKLVPVLIKSVQELKKEIELLKQQLNK